MPTRRNRVSVRDSVFQFIRQQCLDQGGVGVRDIQRHFRWSSPNAPMNHLRALEREGRIVWERKQIHGIRPAEPQIEVRRVGGSFEIRTTGRVILTQAELQSLLSGGDSAKMSTCAR